MSRHSNEARLEEILAICMAELFAEQRVSAERFLGEHEPLSLRESLTAFCGFGSTHFRGSLTILGSVALFSRLHPLPTNMSPRNLADWACELMNQIAGRYRNRLLAYDVSLALAVPQSVLAENVRLSSRLSQRRNPICFSIDNTVLEAWLELNIRPGFKLADAPTDEAAAAFRAGSVLFF
jgi:chemotaxis protein CheX